ncbi:hypothetical protein [Nitrosovibrio sp. Nv6]|uniref:hypothetical protein n=1 Tax=Nitrosovibrio sp. Nv6 TaxID=1855340 RepID=UPI0008B123C6|nr:hypothetical protein [Nitrosovibrio sp. Nv6]SEO79089.1 hypothetical protein SAMN05216316_1110 [Nitrosovibrio sp. Nv6]
MSKPFDLEAAKAGEPIEFKTENGIVPADFIGTHGHEIVIYSKNGYVPVDECNLRMAPKKITVRYRVGLIADGTGFYPFLISTEQAEQFHGGDSRFREWLTDWQEVEITPPEST